MEGGGEFLEERGKEFFGCFWRRWRETGPFGGVEVGVVVVVVVVMTVVLAVVTAAVASMAVVVVVGLGTVEFTFGRHGDVVSGGERLVG